MFKSLGLTFVSIAIVATGAARAEDKAAPTDAQIAKIAVVADNVDIAAGKLAADKAQDPQVKEFANLMVRDHTSVNEKATALVTKLGVTPEDSPTSKQLQSDGDKEMAKLKDLNGA